MQLQKNIPVPLLQNRPLFQAICPDSLWARDNRWLLSRVQRLAGPAGGHGPFVPVGGTNREQSPLFCPGWWLQPGQKAARTFSPGWSYQPGLKVPFSPSSTLHPGQNGSRGHLSSYFTAAPPPSLSSLSLSLLRHFSSSKASSPSLRSLPHLPTSPAQAESGEPPLPAGPARFGRGAASCGPAPAGTGGPASHRRHARPGAGYMAGAGKI